MIVPAGLRWWRDEEGGAAWLASLPAIVDASAARWSLRVGTPFEGSHVSLVVPVERADGSAAVLKVNHPDRESEHEPHALAHWSGRGAVLLLDEHEPDRALLLERCRPGAQLWSVEDDEEAVRIGASVLRRLWRPAPDGHQFRALAAEAAAWTVELESGWRALGAPFEKALLDEAIAACAELGPQQGEPVVLHQDFHGGNVLRAEREEWLAIDPKPLVGEREFDAASLLRDRRWLLGGQDDATRLRRRLDVLTAELGLDRERTRRWGIAHALVWGFSRRKAEPDMVQCARLLAAAA